MKLLSFTRKKRKRILTFIKAIREADGYMTDIFLNGGCYRFYLVLKSLYPSAQPRISKDGQHIVTLLYGELYDIRGFIAPEFRCNYRPLNEEEVVKAELWSFRRNYLLKICDCPHCEEPIIYEHLDLR